MLGTQFQRGERPREPLSLAHHARTCLRARLANDRFRFAELHDRHAACKFARSYGGPPSSSSTMWSAVIAAPLQPGNRIWHRQPSRSKHRFESAFHAGD